MEEFRGAWLTGGYICERILDEKDGTQSLIRVVDTINVSADPNEIVLDGGARVIPDDKAGVIRLYYTASLTQEPPEQSSHVEITHISSLGERISVIDDIMTVEAPNRRIAIVAALDVGLKREGISWFEARLDGSVVLMTPLRARIVDQEPERTTEQPDDASRDPNSA